MGKTPDEKMRKTMDIDLQFNLFQVELCVVLM